jgi:hypothetical protein
VREGRKDFFSEEKKQKTFTFCACGKIPAMASIVEAAEEQKSFGSFLQKRTCVSPGLRPVLDPSGPAGVFRH